MKLEFSVRQLGLYREGSREALVENSYQQVQCAFQFDQDWEGLNLRLVTFTNGQTAVTVLLEGTEVTVPQRVLVEGKLFIAVTGYETSEAVELADGIPQLQPEQVLRKLVTRQMFRPITVYPAGTGMGDVGSDFSPTLAEEVMTAVIEARDWARAAEERAEGFVTQDDMTAYVDQAITGSLEASY